MFSEFFGNYLLNKGLVNGESLKELLSVKEDVRMKLGVLAINAGYMTAKQIQEINNLQATIDKRFGELAIEKGYLTNSQLTSLLKEQKKEHLLLGQTLIDKKILTLEQFENELNSYKKEYSLSDEQFEALKDGNAEEIVNVFLKFDKAINDKVYKNFSSLFFKNIIRFIDNGVRIEAAEEIEEDRYEWVFYQEVKGDIELFTAIAGKEKPLLGLAGKFAKENFNLMDDYAQDAIGEFLNLNNGLFLVNMSDRGTELNLSIQENGKNKKITGLKNAYKITYYLPFGEFDLIMGSKTV